MRLVFAMAVLCVTMSADQTTAQGPPRPTFSAGYELHPHSRLADPEIGPATEFLKTAEIRVGTLTLGATYPMVFGQGRTVLTNELSYHRFDLDYQGFPETVTFIESLHSIDYTARIARTLSDRWRLMGVVKPGVASDLEGGIGQDDLVFQVVAIFVRVYSQRFQVGYGIAWANTFGQPFPLPVLSANWNDGGRVRVSTILPASLEVWYAASPRTELGLQCNISGNRYHLDPDIHGVTNPLLKYSVITMGPSFNRRFADGIVVRIHGGLSLQRRFELADGDEELVDYGLESAGFARVQVEVAH